MATITIIFSIVSTIEISTYLPDLPNIERSVLIYIIIEPVGEQQVRVGSPAEQDLLLRIIVLKIVGRDLDVQSFFYIAEIFSRQSILIVFLVAENENLPAVFRGNDMRPDLRRFCQNPQFRMLQDILFPDLRMSGMGSVEDRIKSPHQRIMGSGHPVLENAEHLREAGRDVCPLVS